MSQFEAGALMWTIDPAECETAVEPNSPRWTGLAALPVPVQTWMSSKSMESFAPSATPSVSKSKASEVAEEETFDVRRLRSMRSPA